MSRAADGGNRVVEEELVEITHTIEQQAVRRVPPLMDKYCAIIGVTWASRSCGDRAAKAVTGRAVTGRAMTGRAVSLGGR